MDFKYLTNKPQYTKLGRTKSDVTVNNTRAPQGCVMSRLLFSLYTDDCGSKYNQCTIIKYADDTVIVGKVKSDDSSEFLAQVNYFVEWCKR